MLHVTNGSVVVTRLHELGLPGRVLPWDDVLHEGPVRAGLGHAALRAERAVFLAASLGGDAPAIEKDLAARDQVLASASTADEVVLWFEHDLYDQLHLLQILDRLEHPRVSGVLSDDYLSAQPAHTLREWFAGRRAIAGDDRRVAQQAWAAFRSADPMDLAGFVATAATFAPCASTFAPAGATADKPVGTPDRFPHLLPALRRHLQQFPWTGNGLSRSQSQALAAVAGGAVRVRDAFWAANFPVEEAIFMGDSTWWDHVRPLIEAPRPLLAVHGPQPLTWTDPAWWHDEEAAPRLTLTADGDAVLSGRADHIALNGIDRWLGGAHVTPQSLWRWDQANQRLREEG